MTRTVLLGDICNVKIGRTPPRKEDQWFSSGAGNKWVSIKDMGIAEKNIFITNEYLTDEAVKKFRIPRIDRGTLILSFKLTVGRLGFASEDMYSNEAIAQLPIKNPEEVDKNWLYYYLKNFNFDSLSSTSSIATAVNSQTIKNIKVKLPYLENQKKIADILGTIDEKIELNRKMNETLEQMGEALFRHYFIDNPEAGEWGGGAVSNLVNIFSGFAFKSADFNPDGEYGLVTIKNVQDGTFVSTCTDHLSDPLPAKTPDYAHLSSGDIILSLTGNVGRVCLVVGDKYLLNQRVAKLEGKNGHQAYAYFLFRSTKMKERMLGISRGTAQMNLSPVETKKLKVKTPSNDIRVEFNKVASGLVEKIVTNNEEVRILAALRDTLLPRLINGKVKV